jgi:hypothetical protein
MAIVRLEGLAELKKKKLFMNSRRKKKLPQKVHGYVVHIQRQQMAHVVKHSNFEDRTFRHLAPVGVTGIITAIII